MNSNSIGSTEVFAVVTSFHRGKDAKAVFSTEELAKGYIEQIKSNHCSGSPVIWNMRILGDIEQAGYVYKASTYDEVRDVHVLCELVGNWEEAKRIAGSNGSVLRVQVETVLQT